ncbi:hypothetical protein ABTN41_19840, partial [Acinetobacter baumannii]
IAETLVGELRLRRKGYVDRTAPVGLLLHHLIHDAAIWSVVDELLAVVRAHPAALFPKLAALMPAKQQAVRSAAD